VTQAIKPLINSGDSHPTQLEYVTVVVSCVRPGAAYRCSTQRRSTGAEIDELSRSYPTQAQAEAQHDRVCDLFATGRTVQQVLDASPEENATQLRLAGMRRQVLALTADPATVDAEAARTWRDAERFLASLANDPDQPSLWDAA
jgi:hypothetical protein